MNETAIKLLKKINENGFVSYLVGGYPRDLYLGRQCIDFDICTNATPMELKKIFGNIISTNEKYGCVSLIINNIKFEITTFRREIKYIDNRKPVEIEYINSLSEDLIRRDFTMNTMCIDSNGQLIDLLNGKEDINNKIIRTVGLSDKKISEDSLRILRAIRFATTLNFKLDEELKESIKKYSYLLKNLSYNRKKEELDKIFSSQNLKYGLSLIKELGLYEPLELQNFENLVPTKYLIGIWSQLNVIDKYTFNSTEKESIQLINELINKDVLDNNNLYKYGLYISTIVAEIKGVDIKLINEKYNSLYIHNKSDINIDANEICKILNKEPGEYLKKIFNKIKYKIINKELNNEKQELYNYILSNYEEC